MAHQDAVRGPRNPDSGLIRAIGPGALAANAINLTVGAGIFVIPANAASTMGDAAIWGYLLCGATMALVMACFAEVGSRISDSGGVFAYIKAAFGAYPAFLLGTVMWFGYAAAADAAVAHVLVDSLIRAGVDIQASWMRYTLIVSVIAGLIGLNMLGVRYGARFATVITVAKLTPLAALLVAGLPHVDVGTAIAAPLPDRAGLAQGVLLLFFVFAGAETALTPSGEIRDPRRSIPIALLVAICVLLTLFVSVHLVAHGVLGGALRGHPAPLTAAAEQLLGAKGRTLLLVGTILCAFGMLAGDVLSTPRAIYATAAAGLLPRGLAQVHARFHTPVAALGLYGVTICGLALSGAFQQLAVLASVSLLMLYLSVCLASIKLRGTGSTGEGLRLPGGPTIAIVASLIIVWLLASVSVREWAWLAGMMAAAAVVYVAVGAGKSTPDGSARP